MIWDVCRVCLGSVDGSLERAEGVRTNRCDGGCCCASSLALRGMAKRRELRELGRDGGVQRRTAARGAAAGAAAGTTRAAIVWANIYLKRKGEKECLAIFPLLQWTIDRECRAEAQDTHLLPPPSLVSSLFLGSFFSSSHGKFALCSAAAEPAIGDAAAQSIGTRARGLVGSGSLMPSASSCRLPTANPTFQCSSTTTK